MGIFRKGLNQAINKQKQNKILQKLHLTDEEKKLAAKITEMANEYRKQKQ